jgi:hypothetical protein
MASTDLVPVGDDSPFALLRMDDGDARDLLADALGGDSLAFKDLDRIKVPSGGGTNWEVPTLAGDVAMKEIEGVIIERASRRAYWPYTVEDRPDDADGKPDCQSYDGKIGVGDPGGDCSLCPFNEFGSDIKGGPGKACKETRQLFILTKDDLLPLVLTIPPASLANVKAYFLRLLRAQRTVDSVVTKVSLEKVKNSRNTAFSKVTLTAGEFLTDDARARVKAYSAILAPMMERVAVEQQEMDEE